MRISSVSDLFAKPFARRSVVTGNLIGLAGVPIGNTPEFVVDEPPHAASSEPQIVMAPEVIAKFPKKTATTHGSKRLCSGGVSLAL